MTAPSRPHPLWCTAKHAKPADPTNHSELHEHRVSGTRALLDITIGALDETTPAGNYSEPPSITCEGLVVAWDMDASAARRLAAKLRKAADQLDAAAARLAEIRRASR